MGLGLHPIFLVAAAAAALLGAIACICFRCRVSNRLKRCILLIAVLFLLAPSGLVFISLKPEWADSRFRTYKHLYRDIQVGMTRSKVMGLIEGHYPSNGKRLRPVGFTDTETKWGLFMNPENSIEPNCEGIFLTIQDDKVEKKKYSRD
jgi:hypothetical protein